MQYTNLGQSELKVSRFGLGTWLTLGDRLSAKEFEIILKSAIDFGINFLDTADSYAYGESEIALGKLLKKVNREKLIIATKAFFPVEKNTTEGGLSPKYLKKALDNSLQRLQTDCIDIYQCHRFDDKTPLIETAEAMNSFVKEGKIREWGVGRFSKQQIETCISICKENNWKPPISNQDVYNLFNRKPEQKKDDLGFIGYSPLARGVLTNKYANGNIPTYSRASDEELKQFIYDLSNDKLKLVDSLNKIAEKYHCSVTQLVLAFYLKNKKISSILIGARTVSQLNENLGALNINLLKTDVEKIHQLFIKYI